MNLHQSPLSITLACRWCCNRDEIDDDNDDDYDYVPLLSFSFLSFLLNNDKPPNIGFLSSFFFLGVAFLSLRGWLSSLIDTDNGVVWLMRLVLLEVMGFNTGLYVGLIRLSFSVVAESSSILEAICCRLASSLYIVCYI